ncbi:AbiTii domain-containing protein [Roseomonas mucosa]|uniref:AbiTii domain-containing protein n=1 Tax=Roseomonas mucosa TaxID=207340 RepID=UPI001E02C751|nr:hypothetical protein [Roseomonas mucosa]MBS5905028.1 hypothetical protein [Acetobacteraceae bacterium]MCG7353293.1 hypothetical protein [Roseomonas mucosa]
MASLVDELERDAYDNSASLANMLRKAKAVAVKLQLQQPMEWVEAELNGYANREVPEYRRVTGQARFQNPIHGWRPVMFGNPDIERTVCEHPISNPIIEIEHLVQASGEPSIALNGSQVKTLCEMAQLPTTLPIGVFFSTGSLLSILDAVRNKVLDWSLSLQAAGIKGEGMSFRAEEKAKVIGKGDTYNIGSIGSFAGNLGGKVGGDVTGTATQNIGQELEKVAGLLAQLRTHRDQMGLDAGQRAVLDGHVAELDEELRGAAPRPGVVAGLLKSIKSVAEGAAGNLIASGVVSMISGIKL